MIHLRTIDYDANVGVFAACTGAYSICFVVFTIYFIYLMKNKQGKFGLQHVHILAIALFAMVRAISFIVLIVVVVDGITSVDNVAVAFADFLYCIVDLTLINLWARVVFFSRSTDIGQWTRMERIFRIFAGVVLVVFLVVEIAVQIIAKVPIYAGTQTALIASVVDPVVYIIALLSIEVSIIVLGVKMNRLLKELPMKQRRFHRASLIAIALAVCLPIAMFGIVFYYVFSEVPAYQTLIPDYIPTIMAMTCRCVSELVPLTLRFVPVESANRIEKAMLDERLLENTTTKL